jgi:hypothetical protein
LARRTCRQRPIHLPRIGFVRDRHTQRERRVHADALIAVHHTGSEQVSEPPTAEPAAVPDHPIHLADLIVQLHMIAGGAPEIVPPSIRLCFSQPCYSHVGRRQTRVERDRHSSRQVRARRRRQLSLPADVDVVNIYPQALARQGDDGIAVGPDGSRRTVLTIRRAFVCRRLGGHT